MCVFVEYMGHVTISFLTSDVSSVCLKKLDESTEKVPQVQRTGFSITEIHV